MKMGETICAIIRIPVPLLKLGVAGFIAMYLNIIPYIWFTHQYAEVIFRADKEYLRQGSKYALPSGSRPGLARSKYRVTEERTVESKDP